MCRLPASDARRTWMVICLVLLGLALQSFEAAAQKPRKGFVLNLGVGPAAATINFVSPFGSGSGETKLAIGTDFIIGHAPTDQLLIYYSNDAAFFNLTDETGFFDDRLVAIGLSGAGVTYFLKPEAPSYYVNAALGIAAWNELSDNGTFDSMTGLGLAVGGGYEFARHFLLDANLVIGRPRGDSSEGYNTATLRFGLIWLAY